MRTYLRHRLPGGTYFFTVNLAQRKHNDLLIRHVGVLPEAFRTMQQRHAVDAAFGSHHSLE